MLLGDVLSRDSHVAVMECVCKTVLEHRVRESGVTKLDSTPHVNRMGGLREKG